MFRSYSGCWLGLLGLLTAAVLAPASPQAPPSGSLRVQVRHLFRGAPLRMDDAGLRTVGGDSLSISRLAYLVTDIALIRPDGSRVRITGDPAYLNPAEGRTAFSLVNVPQGEYAGIELHVGPDAAANHADPSRYGPRHALNPVVSNLHWSWQGGYVFLAIEGTYSARDGRRRGYSYHLGNDSNRVTVMLKRRIRIGTATVAGVDFDAARLFDGISPAPEGGRNSTHSRPGDPIAVRLKQNVAAAVSLAAVRPAQGEEMEASAARRRMTGESPAAHAPAGAASPSGRRRTPAGTTPYPFRVPDGFPQPALPADNPLTSQGVALGRRLFSDKRLSGDGTQSCGSCHRPDAAFSDRGHARSLGIDHLPGTRRAMPLFNLAWSAPYTWDGRRARLRDQALAPIANPREMHAALPTVVRALNADAGYRAQFRAAFGSAGVTPARLGLAIEQYLLTLISADSRFDRASRGEERFTEQEKRGLMLFVTEYDPARGQVGADCFHCHGGNLFTDYRYANNGLDERFIDRGRALVTGREADAGKFKTPSLRNVAITGPYMHDGRFKTLEEVVEHYARGVHRTSTLDPNIAKHPDSGMELSSEDMAALVAFLRTLTDYQYLPRTAHR
ncbi:MAG TPA: MbnP family protein [Chthonomonadaceae bacterium]|nr:MbnP family protein [Chthonomonadaceae bacterium]